ncbi:argininosuccinate lyase [Rurimicrobium arvi]|uniref:Argininosuccinate lyase n=1 Tax=Rurimicrobium arvi TaxID=2049916 RepID=A0ABP8MRB4_9BACT
MKLWQKDNTETVAQIEQFTVGRDREFDLQMAAFDVQGTLAHIRMLHECGLLETQDFLLAGQALSEIAQEIAAGNFSIEKDCEDIHSQIEWMLTQRIGEAGKKIHTGRSRNDQVAVDIKLYLRQALLEIKALSTQLFETLQQQSETYKEVLMPGYTHLQVAMPSSFGLWLGAYAEALSDDMLLLLAAYRITNKNPLGSGAGYGSSLPLNRTRTTELLGFDDLHYNSIYAQMSRGKTEKTVSVAIAAIAATLGRLSMDICLYAGQDYGFIGFPDAYTTGSSIMPHKKNPDVFELIRGKCNRIQALPNEFSLLLANLPSGYHREMQLTKEMLFPAIQELRSCMEAAILLLSHMLVTTGILEAPKYAYLFTVERVNELMMSGIPFRDAYKMVGQEVEQGTFQPGNRTVKHTHEGSIGNLCNEQIKAAFIKTTAAFE